MMYALTKSACRKAWKPKPMKLPPRLYHLAEETNWPSIRRHGLLSTTSLLNQAGLRGERRKRIERSRRLEHTEVSDGVYVRDHKPLPAEALRRCLIRMTPAEWYALINSKVFFWLDTDRLNRQRGACEPRPQVVLEIDTARLVARYADRIALSPINTGNARRQPAKRGRCTFVPYGAWVESEWSLEREGLRALRSRQRCPPAELTIADAVPDIMSFVKCVYRLSPGEKLRR